MKEKKNEKKNWNDVKNSKIKKQNEEVLASYLKINADGFNSLWSSFLMRFYFCFFYVFFFCNLYWSSHDVSGMLCM